MGKRRGRGRGGERDQEALYLNSIGLVVNDTQNE